MTFDLAQRIRDEFPGTPDDEIPGLIRMLRLNRPDDQLRIERNYYRTLSVERAEEALIWRRRFEGPTSTPQNLFSDLEARVSAATSLYARELSKVPPRKDSKHPAAPAVPECTCDKTGVMCERCTKESQDQDSEVAFTPPLEILPSVELQNIRRELGLSRAAMAYRVHISIAKLAIYEQGGIVPPEFMQLAREQLL